MGIGDWLMATADAKVVNEKHNVRVVFGDGETQYWSEVFDNNPRIAKYLLPGERFAWIPNFPGHRPYIKSVDNKRFIYNPDFRATPGELYINRHEKSDYILIEPNVKQTWFMSKNKDWGFDNWKVLVEKLDHKFIQVGHGKQKKLTNGSFRQTDTFLDALYWLAGAKLFIGTDGALHHAAAALGIPAIVLWGGVASPINLGYESHTNIWHGDEPCGTHSSKCQHCIDAMAKISVEEVYETCKWHLAT